VRTTTEDARPGLLFDICLACVEYVPGVQVSASRVGMPGHSGLQAVVPAVAQTHLWHTLLLQRTAKNG
jgi:glycine cleavage system aminomethyltransferase T